MCAYVCVWIGVHRCGAFLIVGGHAKVLCPYPHHPKPGFDSVVCSSETCNDDGEIVEECVFMCVGYCLRCL